MRTIGAATLSQIANNGVVVEHGLILFDFTIGGGALHGFWTGPGEITYNSNVYKPGGSLIEFGEFRENEGLEAITHVMRLRAVPNSKLTPDVLASIESEPYHNAPVTVHSRYSAPDTPLTPLSTEIEFTGYISKIEHVWDDDQFYLEGYLVDKAFDAHKKGHRVRTNVDQHSFAAGDNFYKNAATVSSETLIIGRPG